MWGKHVEAEVQRAARGAKNDKQAQGKAEMRMRMLMTEPQEVGADDEHKDFPKHLRRKLPPAKFRDPAKVLQRKK